MQTPRWKKILFLVLIAAFYLLWNVLPISEWFGEEHETIYLIVKLAYFGCLTAAVLVFKKKLEIEPEHFPHQISYLFLLPLLVCCFGNFMAIPIFHITSKLPLTTMEGINLGLDLCCDFLYSMVEDLMFVDVMLALLFENPFFKQHKFVASLLASLIFTVIHFYSFLYLESEEQYVLAAFQVFYIFWVTLACCYLAMAYETPVVLIGYHYAFNALNHVLFLGLDRFSFTGENGVGWSYFLYSIIIAAMTFSYLAVLWQVSKEKISLPKKKGDVHQD